MDFNERSWERGDISFLFDSSAEAGDSLVILDNKSKVFQRVKYEVIHDLFFDIRLQCRQKLHFELRSPKQK